MNGVQIGIIIFSLNFVSFTKNEFKENELEISGCYANNSGLRESETLILNFFKDNHYTLTYSECYFKLDSGVHYRYKDTIYLYPLKRYDKVTSCIDSSLENKPTRLLYYKGKFKLLDISKTFVEKFYLTKQGYKSNIDALLDKNGDGYLRLIDSNNNTLEEGYYRQFKIYNGVKFYYERFPSDVDLMKLGSGGEIKLVEILTKTFVIDGIEQKEKQKE